ncbi:MAG TPA: hypothetical protein VIU61_28555 [Kofleriaceae bacterium]
MRSTLFVAIALASAACVSAEDKGEEEELLDDSKADSHQRPTDHGPIAFGTPALSALTADERYHAWTFELSATANVELVTSYAVLGQRRTDTVLYLYKETPSSPTGWGPYIARNDDYGDTTYSKLVRELGAGKYRALVKGHKAETRGKFKLTVGCVGPGCDTSDPDACVFGSTYHDIQTNGYLQIVGTNKITFANVGQLSAVDRQQLVLAVQQSSHTDVMTAEEALERVDQNEVNLMFIAEPAAQRMFVAFEYGAGDNSYGAIFDRGSGAMVTNIHDGDLENCTVSRETCLLPDDYTALRNSPEFTRTAFRTVTAAGELDATETAQALEVFRHSYDDVTSVADGLSRVDNNELNVARYTHVASGTELDLFEYGAGDTSVGGIFYRGTQTLAGAINDLAIERCTFFAP